MRQGVDWETRLVTHKSVKMPWFIGFHHIAFVSITGWMLLLRTCNGSNRNHKYWI